MDDNEGVLLVIFGLGFLTLLIAVFGQHWPHTMDNEKLNRIFWVLFGILVAAAIFIWVFAYLATHQ